MNTISKTQKVFLLFVGTIWFFVAIDSFFVWGSLGGVLRIVGTLGLLVFSLMIANKWTITARKMPVLLFVLLFLLWTLRFSVSALNSVGIVFSFLPLFLMFFWPQEILYDWYSFLRKIIVFFAIGSSIISILSLIGVLDYIPHFTLDAHSQLHKVLDYQYYVYGVFVTINSGDIIARACGPLQEPGHFAIILGFFYLIDRFSHRKINIWIVLCGLLTFSMNFFLFFLFTEFHNFFNSKTIGKTVRYFLFALLGVIVLYFLLPQSFRESLQYMVFERNWNMLFVESEASSSLEGALDARASDYSLGLYKDLNTNEFLYGKGYSDSSTALSDYRGFILNMGFIGLLLSVFASVSILMLRMPWRLRISLFLCLFLVYIHRSWMMYNAYPYFLAYMAIAVNATSEIVENEKTT